MLKLKANPFSREIPISSSERMLSGLKSVHQLSQDSLLLQANDYSIVLTDTDGVRQELKDELAQLLKEPCEI